MTAVKTRTEGWVLLDRGTPASGGGSQGDGADNGSGAEDGALDESAAKSRDRVHGHALENRITDRDTRQ